MIVEASPRGKCIYTAPYLPILNILRNGRPSFYRGTRSVRPAGLGLLGVLDGVRLVKSVISLYFSYLTYYLYVNQTHYGIQKTIQRPPR